MRGTHGRGQLGVERSTCVVPRIVIVDDAEAFVAYVRELVSDEGCIVPSLPVSQVEPVAIRCSKQDLLILD
jgi:hypothetical protein